MSKRPYEKSTLEITVAAFNKLKKGDHVNTKYMGPGIVEGKSTVIDEETKRKENVVLIQLSRVCWGNRVLPFRKPELTKESKSI